MVFANPVVIHGIAQARLALGQARAQGVGLTFLSAPGAALYAGCLWWRALIAALQTDQPDLLDCGAAPGRALEAIACGCRAIVLHPCPGWDQVAERAARSSVHLRNDRPQALDLDQPGAAGQIAAWLKTG